MIECKRLRCAYCVHVAFICPHKDAKVGNMCTLPLVPSSQKLLLWNS